MSKSAILMVLDGYALGEEYEYNAIALANTPTMDSLLESCPYAKLKTSGIDVGLMEGQMGDSNVGHLNIGAGRVVWQMLPRILQSIEEDSFFNQHILINAVKKAKENNQTLHVMGLASDGGVHSHIQEFYAVLELVRRNGPVPVKIHVFLDGRDVPPRSALQYIEKIEEWTKEYEFAEVATVSGRYYAMDRDKRWERTNKALDALLKGRGLEADSAAQAVENSYQEDTSDEFVVPTVIIDDKGEAKGKINANESAIFINFRADRARQISKKLLEYGVNVIGMAEYDESLNMPVIFPPIEIQDTLGSVVSEAGLKQLRVAETEKYAHVTFFFNGGKEEEFKGESRILVNSPKVATYDLQPEMSAPEVTEKLIEYVHKEQPALVVVNFANCDMVGHTGMLDATIKAVETVDSCVGKILKEVDHNKYCFVITADHGNADQLQIEGKTSTKHSRNDVPCIVVDDRVAEIEQFGRLADIAPTVLKLMGLPKPELMTGVSLVKTK